MSSESPLFFERRAALLTGAWTGFAVLSGMCGSTQAATQPGGAAGVMLAKPWSATLDPSDYLVSEKLDGVRALWDGKSLRFRSGRPIVAPQWFLATLPTVALDGELWIGRRSFDLLSGTVRKDVPVDAEWRALRYMVFDAPSFKTPFAQRAAQAADVVTAAQQPWLQAVAHSRVPDAAGLQAHLQAVVAGGGEGLVLHRADALWTPGRSDALRKLKLEPDEEGRVIAHVPGTGKYQGKMGALVLEAPGGRRFSLGTGFSDVQRANPPAVGSLVTYRYRDRTASGIPRFASFLRVRDAE
jgi:DNA ligase-1